MYITPTWAIRRHMTTTALGYFDSSLFVGMRNIKLLKFSNRRKVKGLNARLFDAPACQYDLILCRDFMSHVGIKVLFATDSIRLIYQSISMNEPYHYTNNINEQYEDKEVLVKHMQNYLNQPKY